MVEIPINKFFPIEERDWRKIKIHGLWVEFESIDSMRGIVKITDEYYQSLNIEDKEKILVMVFTPWYYKEYSQFKIVRDNNIDFYNKYKAKVGLNLSELDNLEDEDLRSHFILTYDLSLYEINKDNESFRKKMIDMLEDILLEILGKPIEIKNETDLYSYLEEEWDIMKERLN